MSEPKARAVIWAREPKSSRGPQPAFTLDRIARTAIAIADADGLDALTMRSLAKELGTGAMSLYRYVDSKEDVITLMVDASLAEIELVRHDDWRSGLEWYANTLRSHGRKHPWLPMLPNIGPFFGPHGIGFTEHVLGIVDGLGLTIDEMMSTIGIVWAYALESVRQEIAQKEWMDRAGLTIEESMHLHGPYIMSLMETGRYPLFNKVINEAQQPHMSPDESFAYGLDRVLHGIEAGLPRSGQPWELR